MAGVIHALPDTSRALARPKALATMTRIPASPRRAHRSEAAIERSSSSSAGGGVPYHSSSCVIVR